MISIVVPCFNCEKTLERCCESILVQTKRGFELILVDDGSWDNTGKICDEYADRFSMVKVIHQENKGLMAAWKNGVKQSKGDYILFLDSDDWIENSLVERVGEIIRLYKTDIITYGIIVDYDDGSSVLMNHRLEEGFYGKKEIGEKIMPYYFSAGSMESKAIIASRWSKAYKKELLLSNFCFFNEKISIGEDDLTSFAAILDANSLFHIADYAPYHYCRHEGSMMGNYGIETIKKLIDAYDGLIDIAAGKGYPYSQQIDAYMLDNILVVIKKIICSKNKSYNTIVGEIKRIINLGTIDRVLKEGAHIIKHYKLKERLFFDCIIKKRYFVLYFLTRIISGVKL